MSENQRETGKLARFFEEKGFYIILFLCVAAIGIAGYVLFFDVSDRGDDSALQSSEAAVQPDESLQETSGGSLGAGLLRPGAAAANADPAQDEAQATAKDLTPDVVPEPDAVETAVTEDIAEPAASKPVSSRDAVIRDAVETIAAAKPSGKDTAEPSNDGASDEKEAPDAAETAPTFFVRPVSGEIVREFSGDELVYDRTMGDWRTHNGVDFLAAEGTLVSAIADGVVEDVYRDDYYGTGILVDHGGGLKSVYLGLIENATVNVGQTVSAGDTIGAVTASSLFESLEQVHLHLEMTLNGSRVDPMDYLPA